MTKKRLVLIGGGHAHMATLASVNSFLAKGYSVTVIQPSDHHYYSGMGPGMLGGTYTPDDIRFNTRHMVESQGARFIRDKVRLIDPERKCVILDGSDEVIAYDTLSCNAGSYVPRKGIIEDQTSIFTAKPIEGLFEAQKVILERGRSESLEIAIIGGGPSSLEIAGNIWQLSQKEPVESLKLRIFAGKKLMGRMPAQIGRIAHRIFKERNIEVIEGAYVKKMGQGKVLLENGNSYKADLIFPSTGVSPSPLFMESNLPTGRDGGLLVNEYLQSSKYPDIFGGGDCIHFQPQPLDKVGVYAVRQNWVLYNNLMASLDETALQPFNPGGKYLLIYNLGGGVGILSKWNIIFSGRLAFTIKDYIDRKFIRHFQRLT